MLGKINHFVRRYAILSAFLLMAFFTLLLMPGGLLFMTNPIIDPKIGMSVFTAYQIFLAVLGILFMRKLQVIDEGDFKFKNVGKGLLLGWLVYVLMAIIVLTSFSNRSAYFIKPEPLFLLTVIAFPFSTGLFEEVIFRGLALKILLKKMGGTKKGLINAFILSAVFFSAVHSIHLIWTTPVEVATDLVFAIAGGMLLGAIFLRTKTLVAPIALHGLLNLSGGIFDAFTSPEYIAAGASFDDVIIMLIVAIPLIITAFVLLRKVKPEEISQQ